MWVVCRQTARIILRTVNTNTVVLLCVGLSLSVSGSARGEGFIFTLSGLQDKPSSPVSTLMPLPALALAFAFSFFFFFILRRMGKNKALAHHTSTYFHTRRVSI